MNPAPRIATITLSVLLLAGCSAEPSSSSSFESEVTTAAGDSAGGSFALSEIAGVTASSFLVVCPYESEASIEERLGFAWSEAPDYARSGGRQTIALVDDGEVGSSIELPRDRVDFCSAGLWEPLPTDAPLGVSASSEPLRITAGDE
jgi:hypothetical protein